MYGSFIRELRASQRLSQADLAATVGISQPNLSAYERDHRVPTADTLNKLVVACGYQLAATHGCDVVYCPLPVAGWFPDDDDPPAEPGDPADEPPSVTRDTPMSSRLAVIDAVLGLAGGSR